MSVGVPMYFFWMPNMICALGWRSPGMGRIGRYVKGSIGAQIDQGITSWAIDVHVCMVVLDSLQLGDPGRSTGQVASGSWGTSTAKSTRVPSLDYLSETCWIHKFSYKFSNYGIQKKNLVLKQFSNLEYLLLETLCFPIWKTWGKLYIFVYSPKYVMFSLCFPNQKT